ncbi:MAG: 3-phosphoshikimate 1-carboxyvinyltransferase [Prevotella sp.]|nr:3-phosphoshikimate 1-carboxyvinyltransferase [Prevotella sp.]
MHYNIEGPLKLSGDIILPASKSISNRALIMGALAGSDTWPLNLSDCDDTEVIVNALKHMPEVIDIKAAGTAMRFMTAYLAATPSGTHTITGTERMQHRPIALLVDTLRHIGANIEYVREEGFPPLRISGATLKGGYVEMSGGVSSQYISALLMIGPILKDGLTLHLTDEIASRPYIDLTLCMMRDFGAKADWTSVDTISVEPQPYSMPQYIVESDWSAASYWYEMMALTSDPDAELQLRGLMDGSRQGDSSVRYIFSLLGVSTRFETRRQGVATTVTLRKNGHCVPRLDYDFANFPDLAQTFVVCCCAMGVPFHFTGLKTLKIKETDRISALITELTKLGYTLESRNDSELLWDGTRQPVGSKPVAIDTYDDHRMAMAFAPLALREPIVINNPQVVSKSYPRFWEHLRQVGFRVNAD